MAALLAKDQVGVREQLADLLTVADTYGNVLLPIVKKSNKLVNPLFSWIADIEETPSTASVVDGTDVSSYSNPAASRDRLYGRIHYSRRAYQVSRVAEDVADVAGVSSEVAHMKAKALRALSNDVEAVLLGDQDSQVDDGASAGWKTRGLDSWIQSGAQSDLPVPANFRPAAAQIDSTAAASLSEDTDVQGMLKAIYDATGFSSDLDLICGSTLRAAFTTMTRTQSSGGTNTRNSVRVFNADLAGQTITNTTGKFVGDYGSMTLHSSRLIGLSGATPDVDRGYVLNLDKLTLRYNTMPTIKAHPDTGGGERIEAFALFGLEVSNPKCLGKFKP